MSGQPPFAVRDCAIISLAIGKVAHDLRELRDRVAEAPLSSLRHHFIESLLRPTFDDPEFRNDFALWVHESLHEEPLAEKISALDPFTAGDGERLRGELLSLLEERIDQLTAPRAAPLGHEFHFLRSQLVIFSTGLSASDPAALARLVPALSPGAVYFHFVEARLREPLGEDDLSAWLAGWGDDGARARARLAAIDPSFGSLVELRARLATALADDSGGAA
jgi:Family of unknown function (DUF5752)